MSETTNKRSTFSNDCETSEHKKIKLEDGKGSNSLVYNTENPTNKKLEKSEPYNLFFSKLDDSGQMSNDENSISFKDLLCPSLGDLQCSIQFNFLVNIDWLLQQYEEQGLKTKPLTVIFGKKESDNWPGMKKYNFDTVPNLITHEVKMKEYTTHHSKLGLYYYNDNSMRVVVSTANLFYKDWNDFNQGIWISPKLIKLEDNSSKSDGEGPTNFKSSLLDYLKQYELDCLHQWIEHIEATDFSNVKVYLVTSAPSCTPNENQCHMNIVKDLLSKYCNIPEKENGSLWNVVAQVSSIATLGSEQSTWLTKDLLPVLSSKSGESLAPNNPSLFLIYPNIKNVSESSSGGHCLSYQRNTYFKQKWLNRFLCKWKADELNRSKHMPHIKTYCRLSPCLKKAAYFLLTSANLSKPAWGSSWNNNIDLSYEVGVMFLPQQFEQDYFQIKHEDRCTKKLFPFIYDLPLTPYEVEDEPYLSALSY